ncbi:MAG: hypothetical protein IJ262_06985 [Clostridia bacterium]|nr:hypothetical protein [Clostridia bacterium]
MKKTKIKSEMLDKVNYMCRCYMDRIARSSLYYDFVIDYERFRDVLVNAFENVPILHARFVDNHINPYWLVSDDYTVDDLFTLIETDNMEAEVDRVLCEGIELDSVVQYKTTVVTDGKTSWLITRWNHMIMDGGGFSQLIVDIFYNYNEYVKTGVIPGKYNKGQRSFELVYSDMSPEKAKKAKKQFASTARREKLSLPFSKKGEGEDKVYFVRAALDKEIFDKARLVGKRYGATVNDILSAAYIDAFRKLTGYNKKLTLSCAIDLRRHMKESLRTIGYTNYVAFMPCTVERISDNILETLEMVVKSNKENKKDEFMGLHGLPLLKIAYSTMVYAQAEFIVKLFYSNANLALSTMGAVGVDYVKFGNRGPVDAYSAGAVKNKPCSLTTAVTINGHLRLTMCINATEKDKEMVESFFELMKESVIEMAKFAE